MKLYRNNTIRYIIIVMICAGIFAVKAGARVSIQTKIVSGTITAINNNTVELDNNGIVYYPAKKTITMKLDVGSVVTLRYYVDNSDNGTRKYLEYAAGKNTLAKKTPPPVKRKSPTK